MKRLHRDEVVRGIDVQPELLCQVVSDVTCTPQWSPEVISCVWAEGVCGAHPGATFPACNKRSWLTWTNRPVVEVAHPPREFAFHRADHGGGATRWAYQFQPAGSGTDATLQMANQPAATYDDGLSTTLTDDAISALLRRERPTARKGRS